ncbi:MAG: peptidylprolyl isomerase [Planctomycetota bacterium]|nr:peptidylprolyl isomerase [Planctomycetota bacterium]
MNVRRTYPQGPAGRAALAVLLCLVAGCGEGKHDGPGLPYTPKGPQPNPVVLIKTTAGELKAELYEDAAPNTVANFIELAEKNFFDNLTFHRILKDFCIQGGDPEGTGMGGPSYFIPDEVMENQYKNEYGTLAMANSGPNTNGSQFFFNINKKEGGNAHLDGKHTVFGKVTDGFDTLEKLAATKTSGDKPEDPPKIIDIAIVSKRDHPYRVYTKLPAPERKTEEPAKTGKTGKTAKDDSATKTGEAGKTEAPKDEAKTEKTADPESRKTE